MLRILLLLFLALPGVAQGAHTEATCTYKQLGATLGPVRHQGDMGWCYANAAADLLSYHQRLRSSGPYSAIFIALIYNYHHQQTPLFEGGVVKHALLKALSHPLRPASDIESLSTGMCPAGAEAEALAKSEKNTTLKQKLNSLLELKRLYDQGKTIPQRRTELDERIRRFQSQKNIVGLLDRTRLYDAFERSTERTFLLHFADLLCGTQRIRNVDTTMNVVHRSAVQHWLGTHVTTTNDIFGEMDLELNRDNIVGINYYLEFLKDGKIPYTVGDKAEFHSSVVVGRRWKNGSCQYLVRNSWGTSCVAGDGKPMYSRLVDKCDQGNLWIDEKHLRGVTESITFLINGPDTRQPVFPSRR